MSETLDNNSALESINIKYQRESGVAVFVHDYGEPELIVMPTDITEDNKTYDHKFGKHFAAQQSRIYLNRHTVNNAALPPEQKFVGGLGITYRSLFELEMEFSDSERNLGYFDTTVSRILSMMKSVGLPTKIVFIGNGLSPAPLEFIKKYKLESQDQVILTDIIGYRALRDQLIEANLKFPLFNLYISILNDLIEAEEKGDVKFVRHFFGNNNPIPEDLKNASLVINCNGPNESSLADQLSLLSPRGEFLYTPYSGSRRHIPLSRKFYIGESIFPFLHIKERKRFGLF